MWQGLGFDLREAEVLHAESGQPYYHLTGEAEQLAGGRRLLLSVSHDGGMAGAVCLMEAAQEPSA